MVTNHGDNMWQRRPRLQQTMPMVVNKRENYRHCRQADYIHNYIRVWTLWTYDVFMNLCLNMTYSVLVSNPVLCACVDPDPDLWFSGAHRSRSHCNVWWRQGQALERKCLLAQAEVWIVRHSFRPSQSKNRKRAVLILHGALMHFLFHVFIHFLFNRMWSWWFRCLLLLAFAYVCFRTM